MATKLEKVGAVSSASVKKGTKRDWAEWVKILDKTKARNWTHQELVAYLKRVHKLTQWWQQGVARGYKVAIGQRVEGQTLKGLYTLTVTKSLPLSIQKVWAFLLSSEGVRLWLKPMGDVEMRVGAQFECEGGVYGEIRGVKKQLRIRLFWRDEDWAKKTVVQVHVHKRPNSQVLMAIGHEDLPNAREKERMRLRWRESLESVAEALKP